MKITQMKITQNELKNVLAQVEAELATVLKSERDNLSKLSKAAPGEDEGSAGGGEDESAGGPPAAEGSASAGAPPADAAGGPAAPADASAGAPPADGAQPGMEGQGDPAMDTGPVDPAALQAEYEKLAPEELQAHLMAAKAALESKMAQAGAGAAGGPPGAPPMAPPGAGGPPGAPPAGPAMAGPGGPPPPPMGKGEMPSHDTNGDVGKKLGKMESSLKEAGEQIQLLTKALELTLGRPARKAFTGKDFVPPAVNKVDPKSLSKSEITTKLKNKASDSSLAKKERELINGYYNGTVNVDSLAHLLQ